jgi:pimeloyl-ACP methyl ester carboxylesterase
LFAVLAVVGTATAGCAYLESKERELVYRPVREYSRTPTDLGLRFDDVWLAVAGDEGAGDQHIHGWWLPAADAGAPTLLYLHGVRWSLGNNLFRIARWRELGFNVLAIDYRGFGRSDGEMPSEEQIRADARAGWAELRRRETRADQRFIYGHSLGAAVALGLAAADDSATGVIAEAGFTSLPDVIADRKLPIGALLTQRFDALEATRTLHVPALFIHGTADTIVPPRMSEELYAAAAGEKRLLLVEGGSHSNLSGAGRAETRQAVAEFVDRARETQLSRTHVTAE